MVSGCWLGCGIVQVDRKLWVLIWLGVIPPLMAEGNMGDGWRIVLFSLPKVSLKSAILSYFSACGFERLFIASNR